MAWSDNWLANGIFKYFGTGATDHDLVVSSLATGQSGQRPNIRAELKVLTRFPVLMALLTTVLGSGAMFSLYTYIAPSLHRFNDATPSFVTLMLVLIGIDFRLAITWEADWRIAL